MTTAGKRVLALTSPTVTRTFDSVGLVVNPNLYPSSTGYRFKEKDGSVHRGTGWENVIKRVTAYRERNGFLVGDVRSEVMSQACVGNPGICIDDSPRQIVPRKAGYASTMFQKVSSWLYQLVQQLQRGNLPLVDRPEAARRAAICAACPRQMAIPTVCGTCLAQLASFRRVVLQSQAPVDAGLNGCAALGEDTQVSVHLNLDPVTVHEQPDNCWRRTV